MANNANRPSRTKKLGNGVTVCFRFSNRIIFSVFNVCNTHVHHQEASLFSLLLLLFLTQQPIGSAFHGFESVFYNAAFNQFNAFFNTICYEEKFKILI